MTLLAMTSGALIPFHCVSWLAPTEGGLFVVHDLSRRGHGRDRSPPSCRRPVTVPSIGRISVMALALTRDRAPPSARRAVGSTRGQAASRDVALVTWPGKVW